MAKTIFDFMSEEDYARYNELIEKAEVAKANAPKKVRGSLTAEQKIARAKAKAEKYQAELDALLAQAEI